MIDVAREIELDRTVDIAGSERTVLGGAAAVLTAVAFAATAGVPGVVAGVLVVTAWSLSPTYAFAFGQVAVVALVAGDVASAVAIEAGLVATVLAPVASHDNAGSRVPLALGGVLGGALVGAASAWASGGSYLVDAIARPLFGLPAAGAALLVAFAAATYLSSRRLSTVAGREPAARAGGDGRE